MTTILKTRSTRRYALVNTRANGGPRIIGYADYPRSPANERRARYGCEFLPIEQGRVTIPTHINPKG